jgi:predicted DNA-binding protein (UPF0251 family)
MIYEFEGVRLKDLEGLDQSECVHGIFIAEISVFYYRAFLSGDMCVAGTLHHTGLHSGYPGLMPIATGG